MLEAALKLRDGAGLGAGGVRLAAELPGDRRFKPCRWFYNPTLSTGQKFTKSNEIKTFSDRILIA